MIDSWFEEVLEFNSVDEISFVCFYYWHRIRMCLLTHDDVTLSRPDRNNVTISIYFHVMSQALSRRFWGTRSYEKTTYPLKDLFAPCKIQGFPRLIATFFWQLRRRGREQRGFTLAHRMAVNPFARFSRDICVLPGWFLCNSISSQLLATAELLEKHADAHASSMLATTTTTTTSWEPKKLKLASIALKRIQRTTEGHRQTS